MTSGERISTALRVAILFSKYNVKTDECNSGFAVLDKAMHGMKDAAQCFDVASENAKFTTGTSSPCLFHASSSAMSVFRNGEDFVVSGTTTQQNEFEEHLSKHLIVNHLATLGPCTALGDVTGVRILNRIVRFSDRDVNVLSTKLTHEMLS